LASTTGLRNGSTSTPVPSFIVEVRAATAVNVVSASSTGKGGSTPRKMWSQTQIESNPSASALTA